ncbi:MAG: diaminopimelate decarboxylase [Gammaproteobacteria bacterium]|nr:diaminopimelate decarboxylase [Gammaproteobacteria bacterium]
MQHFAYVNGQLSAEQVVLADVVERFGTPCYVYSRAAIEQQWLAYDRAFSGRAHLICYAVKANANLAVLNILARLGSGFDIVSVGELERVLAAGGVASNIVFSGVGKRHAEIRRALQAGIKCFNCESIPELQRINELAGSMKAVAPVSLRINPDVDAKTHPYIATGLKENKFGIPYKDAVAAYQLAQSLRHIQIVGIDCHIGSQITSVAPYMDALERLMSLAKELTAEGIELQHIDVGGGLGICYQDETPPCVAEFAKALSEVNTAGIEEILLEPGRSIVANAGLLLTRVEYLKDNTDRNFAITDAAMNDLLRPALYDAWQKIIPLQEHCDAVSKRYDLVGPVCETGDFLGLDRQLSLYEGDILAVCSAGAYGFSMSSNYNARPRAPEVMVDGDKVFEIRRRESVEQLMAGEAILPDSSE